MRSSAYILAAAFGLWIPVFRFKHLSAEPYADSSALKHGSTQASGDLH